MKIHLSVIGSIFVLASFNAIGKLNNNFSYFGISFQKHNYSYLEFTSETQSIELNNLVYKDSLSGEGSRVFIGKQFNNYLAFELGYTSFHRANFSINQTNDELSDKLTGEFKTSAGDIRVIGTYPITKNIFIKSQIGLSYWDNKYIYLTSDSGSLSTDKAYNTGYDFLTGVGVGYGVNDNVAISFDIEKTKINNIDTDNMAVSLLLSL